METTLQTKPDRLLSLDVFRGLTIAGMVLVNNPGTWSAIYSPLKHAEWNGITPTDYIFPFFLFIVGVAIPLSLSAKSQTEDRRTLYSRILTRSVAIFLSGIAISVIPLFVIGETSIHWMPKWIAALSMVAALFFLYLRSYRIAAALVAVWGIIIIVSYAAGAVITWYNPATVRIPGVLQRIAVCYLFASVIFVNFDFRSKAAIIGAILIGYWILMTVVPVPGCETWSIDDKACNLAAWLDRAVLTEAHIWRSSRVFDPEGILSTLPALATTLFGVMTGEWLLSNRGSSDSAESVSSREAKLNHLCGLFFAGTVLLAVGWGWSLWFPLNKSLWTSSYSVYTAGLALLTLAVCHYIVDFKGFKTWAKPLVIFGVNALALFVFSGIMARLLGIIKVAGAEGKEVSLQQWIFTNIFLPFASPVNASLAYAISFLGVWLG
ncbi:MAG: DUF5009 domain-containing protein, partial [Blastocatellia bacterium]